MYYCTQSRSYHGWLVYIFIKSTIENIGADKYANLIFPIPFINEQTEIVNYLDQETSIIDQLIEKINKQIEQLNEYKTSLISHGVTGKIDVRGEID
jgi:type I restriction enzyme S subunit